VGTLAGGRLTVLVTVVTDGPVPAVHISRIITPDFVRFKQKIVPAGEVFPLAPQTMCVLPAVVGVRVPAIRHVGTVHGVVTHIRGTSLWVHTGSVATVHLVGVVAVVVVHVVQESHLALDPLGTAVRALVEEGAVVRVGELGKTGLGTNFAAREGGGAGED